MLQLKLHAINFAILPTITEDYNSKATANSADTIITWNKDHMEVGSYLMSYSVILYMLSLVISSFAISFYLFAKPHDYFNRAKVLINSTSTGAWEIKTQMFIIMAMSIVFSIYVLSMDVTALVYKGKVHEEFNDWYKNDTIKNLNHLNICFFVLDALIFAGTIVLTILSCCYNCIKESVNVALPYYFFLFPIAIIASRIDLIIIGFIQNPFHATGVAVSYGIMVISCIAILEMSSHLFHIYYECKPRCLSFCCICAFISIIIVLLLFFVYLVALYFLVPINNAFDEAPNEIITIYQSVVVLLGGFFVYWILLRLYRSPLDILIKARDLMPNQTDLVNHSDESFQTLFKDWSDISDAVKEKRLAQALFRIMEGLLNSMNKDSNAIQVKTIMEEESQSKKKKRKKKLTST